MKLTPTRGVARNSFGGRGGGINFWGGIKLQYSCSIAILTLFLPNKKFTWADFGGIYTHIPPVATPLTPTPTPTHTKQFYFKNLILKNGQIYHNTERLSKFG